MTEVLQLPKDGGALVRPWECPEEVPESIWKGHLAYNSNLSTKDYLAYLNYIYYTSYQATKQTAKRESKKTPCAAPHCTQRVDPRKPGPNLCPFHMRELKRLGEVGNFHYLGESP